MEKKDNLNTAIMRIFAVLLCLTLVSLWLLTNMFARYTTQVSSEDSARVAAYVFSLEDGTGSQILDLKNIKKPGDTQTYTFTVQNQRGNTVSEVAQKYSIKLEVNGSMPITCEVKEDAASDGTINSGGSVVCKASNLPTESQADFIQDVDPAESGEHSEITNISESISLSPLEQYKKTYILTVTWPGAYNDAKYSSASGTSVVTLTVNAEQVD